MKRSHWIILALASFVVLATVGLLFVGVDSSFKMRCEVCVYFHGQEVCRTAEGATEEEATRTAQDNACAFLASGRRESMACNAQRPSSATCTELD